MLRPLTQNDLYSIEQVKRYAKGHFFSPDTMRFFSSRVSESIYNGVASVYFVTSERGPSGVRAFTVRRFDLESRSIDSASEFNSMSRARAHSLAKQLSQNEIGREANLNAFERDLKNSSKTG